MASALSLSFVRQDRCRDTFQPVQVQAGTLLGKGAKRAPVILTEPAVREMHDKMERSRVGARVYPRLGQPVVGVRACPEARSRREALRAV